MIHGAHVLRANCAAAASREEAMPPRVTDGQGRRRPSDLKYVLGRCVCLASFPCDAAQFAAWQAQVSKVTVAECVQLRQCFAVDTALCVAQGCGF